MFSTQGVRGQNIYKRVRDLREEHLAIWVSYSCPPQRPCRCLEVSHTHGPTLGEAGTCLREDGEHLDRSRDFIQLVRMAHLILVQIVRK